MAVKKKAAKKTAAKKTAAAAPAVKAIPTKQTKTQIIAALAETTGLSKKDIGGVLAALGGMIEGHMKKRGSGEFSIPDTGVKIRRVKKPARKARMGRNPATGEDCGQAGVHRGSGQCAEIAEGHDQPLDRDLRVRTKTPPCAAFFC